MYCDWVVIVRETLQEDKPNKAARDAEVIVKIDTIHFTNVCFC